MNNQLNTNMYQEINNQIFTKSSSGNIKNQPVNNFNKWNKGANKESNNVKGFTNSSTYNYASPLNFNIGNGVLGSYDNLSLRTTCSNGWSHTPCDPPKKSNIQYVPQGTPLPLKNEEIYSQIPDNSMFIFSRSYASPDCCPSTFSTDRGCICNSDQLKAFIGEKRGNNVSYNNYNF